MTDRKPLEELFDFPTSSEPNRPVEDAGENAEAVAQQDLLFDEEPRGVVETPSGPTELFDEPGVFDADVIDDEPPWQSAAGPPSGEIDGEASEEDVTLADRWMSGAADVLLLVAVLCIALLSMLPLGLSPARDQWPGFALFLASFSFMYCTFPLAFWGQTPGMAWRGLRAINDDGLSLSFSQTTLRWVGGGICTLLLGLPLVVALTGRSIADRLSGSWTIRA